ncbi:MAG TPA: rhombosortase [Steroidobacteraceae bacterium]|jgi:rhomboid family GlyGly-CTERM serine protease
MKFSRTDTSAQSWFRSANCDGRYGVALLATVGVLLLFAATGEAGREHLQYERSALAQWQWWRLLGAHLVHLGWQHALLNCAGLALLWALFAREFTPRRWLWIALASALAIDAGLWFLRPEIAWYLGASGVLHGLWAAGAWAMYRRGDGMGATLLLLLIVKLVYEQQSGASLVEHNLPLVPAAHLFGTLGGLIAALLPRAAAKSL